MLNLHKNQDFEKITSENYTNLFHIFELMCEENWGGSHESVYVIYSKEDFVIYLTETSKEIDTLVDAIKIIIGGFTEDDLIRKAKKIIRSLKNFKNNIDDLVNNSSDTMISDEKFVKEVKNLLIKLLPSLEEYGEQLQITNKVFKDRLTGHSRSSFGSGFSLN
jgi:hypothetical protein